MNQNENLDYSKNEKDVEVNNSKFKKILKKIFVVLTIIVAVIGCAITAFCVFTSFTMESIEFFGPILNLLVFMGGFVFLIYAVIIIAIMWIIYGMIILLYNVYSKLNLKQKYMFALGLILLLLLIAVFSFLLSQYKYNNKNISEVLREPPSYELYKTSSYYFIYDDKIYYYVFENTDDLYVMNLDGSENKKIVSSDELRYADFYFVYNNEAYYYTLYHNDNKKINLSTGEITSLDNDEIYISKSLRNGQINTFIDNAVVGNDYALFKKVDLKNNKVLSEVKTKYSMSGKEYYLDYDGGNIYYLESFYSEYPTIYKNNDVIYQFIGEDDKSVEFIAINDNYVYFKSEDKLYKLDVNLKEINNDIYFNLGDIHRISSGNNDDNYFYINGNIYEFDMSSDVFKLLLTNIKNKPEYVYSIGDKLIFTENTDNLEYKSSVDNLGSVLIYSLYTKKVEKFEKLRKVSFDENTMYLLIDSDGNYVVQKYELKE